MEPAALVEAPLIDPPPTEPPFPTGARVAGAILMLNALCLLVEFWTPGVEKGATPFHSPVHVLVDLAIGGALLRGRSRQDGSLKKRTSWPAIAKLRVLIGLVFFTVVAAVKQDWFQAGMQVVFSGALLALLVGNAGRLRLGFAIAGASLMLAAEGMGLLALWTGQNPTAAILLRVKGELDGGPIAGVRGERAAWTLAPPKGRWYLRASAAASRDNWLVDRWLINPAFDAHVLMIVEPLPDGADVDAVAEAMLTNARAASSQLKVIEAPAPLDNPAGPARIWHTVSTINGMQIEGFQAVFVGKSALFEVTSFVPSKGFPRVADDFKKIIGSFRAL